MTASRGVVGVTGLAGRAFAADAQVKAHIKAHAAAQRTDARMMWGFLIMTFPLLRS
jgi:hypothetical protein